MNEPLRWWWCHGHHSRAEAFIGPLGTREAAIAEARQGIADNFDDGGFSVVEAEGPRVHDTIRRAEHFAFEAEEVAL